MLIPLAIAPPSLPLLPVDSKLDPVLVLLGSEEDEDEGGAGWLIVAVFAASWKEAAD